eukprot:scaffold3295_cov269-Alexandrium_tamarense.AAC.3
MRPPFPVSPFRYTMDLIVDFPSGPRDAKKEPSKSIININNRRVRFSSTSQLKFFDHSQEDQSEKWYAQKEKQTFKQTLLADTSRMATTLSTRGFVTVDELHHTVGLEGFLSRDVLRRSALKRQNHKESILSLQEACNTEEALCKVSEKSSLWARERAHKIATGHWAVISD